MSCFASNAAETRMLQDIAEQGLMSKEISWTASAVFAVEEAAMLLASVMLGLTYGEIA
jgi:hypothetical protein